MEDDLPMRMHVHVHVHVRDHFPYSPFSLFRRGGASCTSVIVFVDLMDLIDSIKSLVLSRFSLTRLRCHYTAHTISCGIVSFIPLHRAVIILMTFKINISSLPPRLVGWLAGWVGLVEWSGLLAWLDVNVM